MAETISSPGVIANENNQSFISAQPVQAGAAIIGPTVKGPVEVPTIVTTYSDYTNTYGTTFLSGSTEFSYLTSISAYNYFNSGGTSLLVTRVTSGSFTPATSEGIINDVLVIPGNTGSLTVNISSSLVNNVTASLKGLGVKIGTQFYASIPNDIGGAEYQGTVGNTTFQTVNAGTLNDYDEYVDGVVTGLNLLKNLTGITASYSTPNFTLESIDPGTTLNGTTSFYNYNLSGTDPSTFFSGTIAGGSNSTGDTPFILETLSEGEIMNSTSTINSDGSIQSGSLDNLRWQILSPNISEGTFTLFIRRGDDDTNSPVVLESWDNLSLDPKVPNYIEKVIGNQTQTIAVDGADSYIKSSGDYPNQSSYVRIKQVNYKTPDYIDNQGDPVNAYTASIPILSSGSFGSAIGSNISTDEGKYYENITGTNIQGLAPSDYTQAIALLSNKEEYKYNFITAPGLINSIASHTSTITSITSNCQSRGDTMAIIDLVPYNTNITPTLTQATSINNSYTATYWPWLQTLDPNTGAQVWIPASTMLPSVYAFNDAISEVWFAPAGNSRGLMPTVLRAERRLTLGNRDTLYQKNINPLTTQTGVGVVVYGQKTLQKKRSALDRVNVRRLLINLKSTISQIADNFVFEPNDVSNRNSLSSQINSYLSSVQQRQGLYAYNVVMDESNNTSTVIDNNQLVGQIFIQPTKTAEFIILDFNVLPTGATFE